MASVRKISDGSSSSRNRPLKLSANQFCRGGRRAALLALALYHRRDYLRPVAPSDVCRRAPRYRQLIKYRQNVPTHAFSGALRR